ncbi:MAG: CoA transferase [Elusimicrobia bacterium]|nr:CoA transferase [Elusimicrobiota bacterium]
MPKNNLPGRPLGGIGIPFKGFPRLRVLDFSKLLPGPYATQVLADMGCQVTRVELPHFGDMTRDLPPKIGNVGSTYWMVNQGKKRLCFDFRKREGMRRLQSLIKASDVLVEGFRPGLMERLGLGFRAVQRLNPRLIYCSITGYPSQGPMGRKAGHDLNFLAASGFLGLGNSEGRIAFPPTQIADLAGSMGAVSGILAALLERGQTGKGRQLQLSLAQAVHSWLVIPLGHLKATGKDPSLGRFWWNGAHPFYRLYRAKDGRELAVAAVEKGFAVSLLDCLGLSRLRNLADDPMRHRARLSGAMSRVFRTAALKEWESRFKGKDFCVSPVRFLAEAKVGEIA